MSNFSEEFYKYSCIKKFPPHLNTVDDYSTFLNVYYSREAIELTSVQRLGQLIFNLYDIENNNSYQDNDPEIVYNKIKSMISENK